MDDDYFRRLTSIEVEQPDRAVSIPVPNGT